MDKLIIKKSLLLVGDVVIFGVKNVVLLLLMISLLMFEFCCYMNVLVLCDINIMVVLFKELGVGVVEDEKNVVMFYVEMLSSDIVSYELVCIMCVFILVFGLLFVWLGIVNVLLFGGCVIGVCLVNLYLVGLEKMGVNI